MCITKLENNHTKGNKKMINKRIPWYSVANYSTEKEFQTYEEALSYARSEATKLNKNTALTAYTPYRDSTTKWIAPTQKQGDRP
jgi:hypothetical protein